MPLGEKLLIGLWVILLQELFLRKKSVSNYSDKKSGEKERALSEFAPLEPYTQWEKLMLCSINYITNIPVTDLNGILLHI